jgi:Asp-tRNA(Asn)/Glu-tRNA(Gln) amidotransferase C subunit
MAYNRLTEPIETRNRGECAMSELNNDEIRALAKAAGLEIPDSDITDVNYSLNAIIEAMDGVDLEGLNAVEPLAIILQNEEAQS